MRSLLHSRFVGPALLIAVITFGQLAGPANAQDSTTDSTANPLAQFERIIGGEWHMEGTYQVFKWGLGKLSVHAESYVTYDDGPRLVGDGMWFWHPGEERIRGFFTGVDMGVDLWDYTTKFHADTIVNDLVAYGTYGGEYHETWTFTSNDEFVWTLYQKQDGALTEFMKSTYTRKK